MTAVCQVGDLGPGCLDLQNVRAGDRNLMYVNLASNGKPVDVTGMQFQAQARARANDPDPPSVTALVGVVDGPNGRISLQWPGDQVRAMMNGSTTWKGVWDLQEVIPGSDPVTVLAGKFGATYDVTR